jgi:hypothetical protein
MKKAALLSVAFVVLFAGLSHGANEQKTRQPDDRILADSGIPDWVPNPLTGTHPWKKVFSDEKYAPSKQAEEVWYFDHKGAIKATREKATIGGQDVALEGATLVWIKVAGLKPERVRYLFYAFWPSKRVALLYGIFENDDGTKYVETVGEMVEVAKAEPGYQKAAIETLSEAVFKPWYKVW